METSQIRFSDEQWKAIDKAGKIAFGPRQRAELERRLSVQLGDWNAPKRWTRVSREDVTKRLKSFHSALSRVHQFLAPPTDVADLVARPVDGGVFVVDGGKDPLSVAALNRVLAHYREDHPVRFSRPDLGEILKILTQLTEATEAACNELRPGKGGSTTDYRRDSIIICLAAEYRAAGGNVAISKSNYPDKLGPFISFLWEVSCVLPVALQLGPSPAAVAQAASRIREKYGNL